LPFGAADGGMLIAAARLAECFGDGRVRVTSERRLVLTGLHGDRAALLQDAAAAGFITDAADPRLRIAACAGRPACASAAADVRADAALLAPHWRRAGILHLSGCAKGCAHPGAAAVTLVAAPAGYGLVVNERAGAAPTRTGLALPDLAFILAERPIAAA
jgi:precorrin-3B synthase